MELKPQAGPQEQFLKTIADIAIYGGAAGGGKSFALLLEPLRHIENKDFRAVMFRRTTKQVRNKGGLWDESLKIYPLITTLPYKETTLEWQFESGMQVQFAHLEHEKNIYDYQGSQIPLIGFDELTHFTENQFFYMLSRNRSTSGVAGYVRATTNPDPASWVKEFIQWWIDEESGLAIPERSGVIRYFIRKNGIIYWGDSRQELIDEHGEDELPKSVTFISAKLTDNRILMEKDPSYLANLRALTEVERARLEDGNWNVVAAAGSYFKKTEFEIVDAAPEGCAEIRYWDRAATEPNEENKNPDWTVGLKLLRAPGNIFYVADVVRIRKGPLGVERAVLNTAQQDGIKTQVGIEQDPGSAGKADADNYTRLLSGFVVKLNKPTADKETRAKPVSAQVQAGNIKLVRGAWNKDFLTELENFPSVNFKDDQVDAFSGAFNMFHEIEVGSFGKNKNNSSGKTFAGSISGRKKW